MWVRAPEEKKACGAHISNNSKQHLYFLAYIYMPLSRLTFLCTVITRHHLHTCKLVLDCRIVSTHPQMTQVLKQFEMASYKGQNLNWLLLNKKNSNEQIRVWELSSEDSQTNAHIYT